jgi:hypothetical protein
MVAAELAYAAAFMCPARRPFWSIGILVVAVLLTALLGAAAAAQVATLGSPAPDAEPLPSVAAGDGQEALLDYAACMREHGISMDDPRFGADGELIGGLGKGGSGVDVDPKGETYQSALEACGDLLVSFKTPPDPAQQAEQAEALLAWAGCMREQGIDLPDPNADGGFPDYDWKIDLKGDAYALADAACRESLAAPVKD